MSNSNINVTADATIARAKSTHYAVSTFAAVVYAVVWLLASGAHAESKVQAEYTVLPELIVTGHRSDNYAMLPAIVVEGVRDTVASTVVLDPIVVTGQQDSDGVRVAATNVGYTVPAAGFSANTKHYGYVAKVNNWLRAALLK